MFFSHLLPATLLTLGGTHAGLHPATSNLYVELPDLGAVVEAYQDAPLVNFLHDERIRIFVAKIAGEDPETFNVDLLIADGLNELYREMPPEALQALDVLAGLEWFSLSLSGVELDGLSELVAASQGEMTPELKERISRLQLKVVLDLGSPENAGEALSLLQLGAKETDGELRKVDLLVPPLVAEPLEAWVLSAPDDSGFEVWAIQLGSSVTMGAGIGALDRFIAGGPTLAENESYQKSAVPFVDAGGTTIVDAYFHFEGLSEIGKLLGMTGEMPAPMVEAISFLMQTAAPGGQVEARTRSQLVGNRFITESFRYDHGDGATILDIAGNQPVSPESFRMVPEDAVACWATTLDKKAMRAFLGSCLEGLCVEDPEQCLVQMEEQYGARPDKDLIDALGDEYVFYTMPFAGIGMPKVFCAIELEDPESFARGMDGFGTYLADVTDGAVEFRSKPYRKRPFASFSPGMDLTELAGGGAAGVFTQMTPAFVSLAASIGVLEDRAVISLSSMYTKREMKRLMRGEGGMHPLTSSQNEIPEGATSYGTTDWGTILAGVYDAIAGFIPLIQQAAGGELPFGAEDLPSSVIFKEYFRPTVTYGTKVEGGVYAYNEASFGPEIPAAASAARLTGAIVAAIHLEEANEMKVREAPAAPGGPEAGLATTPRQVTIDALRETKISIIVYKSDQDRYPDALTDLLDPTDKFSGGFFQDSKVPEDGWGNQVNYSLSKGGSSFRIWSSGPDGINQNGDGDDVILSK